jgi:hypothetical protein
MTPTFGRKVTVDAGTAVLNNGEFLALEIPRGLTDSTVLSFVVVPTLNVDWNYKVVAYRSGTQLIFITGLVLDDGDSSLGMAPGSMVPYVAVIASPHVVGKQSIMGVRTVPATIVIPTLTVASPGRVLVVKDETGTANTDNITIQCESGELIDGQASLTIDEDYASVMLYTNGTGVSVMSGAVLI